MWKWMVKYFKTLPVKWKGKDWAVLKLNGQTEASIWEASAPKKSFPHAYFVLSSFYPQTTWSGMAQNHWNI